MKPDLLLLIITIRRTPAFVPFAAPGLPDQPLTGLDTA
jgi:hypothetical protein